MKRWTLLFVALLPLVLWSCGTEQSTLLTPQFGGAPGGPSVKSVNPGKSEKGVTLDITVNGAGFDQGTRVDLGLQGVPSAHVHTNSTRFVNSKQVIANVTISLAAETELYDVIATSVGGKKGIGTELFAIDDPTATFYLPNDPGYMLQGDGVGTYLEPASSPFAGTSRYMHGECGVFNLMFVSPAESGDVVLSWVMDRKCASAPRKVRIRYFLIAADGSTVPDGSFSADPFMNVRKMSRAPYGGTPSTYIPIGSTERRTMAFQDNDFKCGLGGEGAIVFTPVLNTGVFVGADSVQVYRSSADTWVVSTLPDEIDATGKVTHHDKAYCRNNGKLYHMPLRVVVRSNIPLP